MSRFLFTVWPFAGHINPNVTIARELHKSGHTIGFYTGASLHETLSDEGFHHFSFVKVDESSIVRNVRALDSISMKWWKMRESKCRFKSWLLDSLESQIDDVESLVKDWHPDVIVCDPTMWGPFLVVTEKTATPLAVMSYTAACMLPGPQGPILGAPLPKSRGTVGRVRHRLLRSIFNFAAADVRRTANRIRKQHDLNPISMSVTAYAGQMPLYIMQSSPLFDRNRSDLPPSVCYVGPCNDLPSLRTCSVTPTFGAVTTEASSDDVNLSWHKSDKPLVYVTEGTLHAKSPILLQSALAGLADLPIQLVMTTGKHREPKDLGFNQLPNNVRLEQWIPHAQLLPDVDVLVTTGGTGTVLSALQAGIPMVIVPTAWDQPENAWRIVECGAGIRLSRTTAYTSPIARGRISNT